MLFIPGTGYLVPAASANPMDILLFLIPLDGVHEDSDTFPLPGT